jgi:glutamate carboxypeptidase
VAPTAWIAEQSGLIAATAQDELAALVAVSSPSGDVPGAEACVSVVRRLLPADAEVERIPCSTPDHADDLLATVRGTGTARILLLGHVDTVVAHSAHRPLGRDARHPERLVGSGSVDMKGGDVLALGVLRALAATRRDAFAEAALLLVTDEEWRAAPFAHAERFRGWDACLCFEAGEVSPDGDEAVVVRRKAAGTLRVTATGVSAHSGARPDEGRNALLALATAAQVVAAHHDPEGPDRLTAVPTVMHCGGEAHNVVPAHGELLCDVRADRLAAFDPVMAALPDEVGGAALAVENLREWPGMDSTQDAEPVLAAASARLGRPILPRARGGASDASHLATVVPLTIDGLGPRGGGAHAPHEYVLVESLRTRSEVALAVADAVLAP